MEKTIKPQMNAAGRRSESRHDGGQGQSRRERGGEVVEFALESALFLRATAEAPPIRVLVLRIPPVRYAGLLHFV